MAARGQKPMISVANTMMASAALWLGAGADEIWATKSAGVGSIGVIRTHEDHSEADAKDGVKYTYIHSSPYKAEGNRHAPLSAEAMDFAQEEVDHFDTMFTDAIANARGVPGAKVRTDYGQGRLMHADKALGVGLVDQIGSVEQAISSIALGATGAPRSAAAMTDNVPTLALSAEAVVDLLTQRAELPFGKRLNLVSDEVEALVAHARARQEMRANEETGRSLSKETRESLSRLAGQLQELGSDPVIEEPAPPKASTSKLHLMLRTYGEED
jgi:ClpP class serine protease